MGIVDSPNGRSRKKKGRRRSKRIGFHLVSLDGTKVQANASKHQALSWQHADVMKRTKEVYDFVKSKTGLEYMIYDYYEVPELARELKIDENTLPDNLILYKGAHGKMIYKRLVNGYSSATQIIYNTKFMFENAILEEDKAPQDKSK